MGGTRCYTIKVDKLVELSRQLDRTRVQFPSDPQLGSGDKGYFG